MKKIKRVLAIAVIILLVACYVMTAVLAFTGAKKNILMLMFYIDIALPTFIYVFMLVAKILRNRKKQQKG